MQPFANKTFSRRRRPDVAPTPEPAAVMQIVNPRPHPAGPTVQRDAAFHPYALRQAPTPTEVDFFGPFEGDAEPGDSAIAAYAASCAQSQRENALRDYAAPYLPVVPGLTEPGADRDASDINLRRSPAAVDFLGPSGASRASVWLQTSHADPSQRSSSGSLQVANDSHVFGTVASFPTCPSLTDPSWNSAPSDMLSTPQSHVPSGSFDSDFNNSNHVLFPYHSGGFISAQDVGLGSPEHTWSNSDINSNHESLNTFHNSGLENHGFSEIPRFSTFNADITNPPQLIRSAESETFSISTDIPLNPTGLLQRQLQQLQGEPEDCPRRSNARANPLCLPRSTENLVAPGNAFPLDKYTSPSYDCFVMENGPNGTLKTELPQRKGIRKGSFEPEKAKTIAERRKNGTTCMRCRTMRIECDGGDPCQKCVKAADSLTLMYPCIKAAFLEIILRGTCNYISQRAINHLTLDGSRRIQMLLPKEFNVDQLVNLLSSRRQMFNIRARQASGSLYVLDLANCYNFLRKIRRTLGSGKQGDLRTFIDDTLAKPSPWSDCVQECDPNKDKVALLSKWNNMPSRASYSIVSLEEGIPDRPLDPENAADRQEILIAAQVSRIICRKLEIDGYKALQTSINDVARSHSPDEKIQFVQELGRILCSLRWRMSWWELLGDGSQEPDPFCERFIERVRRLSRVLYFYFFTLKDKIAPWSDIRGLQGVWSTYPDARPVFDDFPLVSSIQAFEEWMDHGKALIREANVQGRFSR